MGNHQPKLQDPTPQQERRTMRNTGTEQQRNRARGSGTEGGGGARKRKKAHTNYRGKALIENVNGGELGGINRKSYW